MPKLNATHLSQRIQELIDQLERGEEVEAKKNKTLLSDEQQTALDDAWAKQQVLRKKHKPPKTKEERIKLGWKDKREVRIEIYKQALEKLNASAVDDIKELQRQREIKAARIYLDAYFGAPDGNSRESAGNIALVRAGFRKVNSTAGKRDPKVRNLERSLREILESQLTEMEREQLKILQDHEKWVLKRRG